MSTEVTILLSVLAFIGGCILWFAGDIRSRIIRLETKIDKKMDVEDHTKQAELCVKTLSEKFSDAWLGVKERLTRGEKCLLEHTHDDKSGKTIIRGGL
jgi:hypothetical protein